MSVYGGIMKDCRFGLFVVTVSLCLSTLTAHAKIATVLGSIPLKQNTNLAAILPQSNDAEILLSRPQYVISYNPKRRAPNWVAWELKADDIGSAGRTDVFSKDTELETYLAQTPGSRPAVDSSEYSGSCFDRGHQVPSKDRTDNTTDNAATFLTSNIIPQTAYLNRVIWEHLEQYTRNLVVYKKKKVYVIAGPIYDDDFGAIGPHHDIPVPSKDFKVIYILDANQTAADINANTPMIAVIMPNVLQDGSKPLGKTGCNEVLAPSTNWNDWQQYQTGLVQVQQASGLQFQNFAH
jgi:endonuclease G